MSWNMPQHSYEEIREVVVDALLSGQGEFARLLEEVGRRFGARHRAPALPTGPAYPGAASQMHPYDTDLVREVVWDLFRQGIITLGSDASNPNWPWFKLSRFGQKALEGGYHNRFHDTEGYLRSLREQVPDISPEAVVYLEEAVASFYAGCMLASVVMLGVAAEAEFLRLIEVAVRHDGPAFAQAEKAHVIRQKVVKFQTALQLKQSILLPKQDFEDLETNLTLIQSVLRVARNEAGHPNGHPAPSREQVYIYLQMFIPFAKQVMKLRVALS